MAHVPLDRLDKILLGILAAAIIAAVLFGG
jgi:hypothetical protein